MNDRDDNEKKTEKGIDKKHIKRPQVEMVAIINQICSLMIQGMSRRADIFGYIQKMDSLSKEEQRKRNWTKVGDKCEDMIDRYIASARESFIETGKESRENFRALYIAQLEDLYLQARKNGNIQTANNIMKNKMYLQGMGGFNVSGNFNMSKFDVTLTPEQEEEYKRRIQDMYGENIDSGDPNHG